MSKYDVIFSPYLNQLLKKKYSGIKNSVKRKIKLISQDPYQGEPLRHDLDGLRSLPVKKNYILIYVICKECREKDNTDSIGCTFCTDYDDMTVLCFLVAPHDSAYKIAEKIKRGKISE